MGAKKTTEPEFQAFSFSQPAIYEIKVLGELSTDWSERLQNMKIEVSHKKEGKPISTLTGLIRDQSALAGILNTLYELHLSVLSVKILDKNI